MCLLCVLCVMFCFYAVCVCFVWFINGVFSVFFFFFFFSLVFFSLFYLFFSGVSGFLGMAWIDLASWIWMDLDGLGLEAIYPGMILYAFSSIRSLVTTFYQLSIFMSSVCS